MRTERSSHGCFSIEEAGTVTKVVVMGGNSIYKGINLVNHELSTAEILDVTSMQWENLPDLPFRVSGNKGVESYAGPYLGFSVGGFTGRFNSRNHWEQRICGLRKNQNGYYWEILYDELRIGRGSFGIVNAPLSMFPTCFW